ncbi:hypothetical protein CR152_09855 [Massilia violaceinigra]|uniref:DUF4148 domain-containing protein n=1 Tax=Massilia violaceinigra TaxID=2045208 RepID=A0A2D2DII8_9BURK|nr:hypothetical protein [Massilia violaceinigra]ATQ74792.1 hypothetical protein CR152_09855 [Massilia violaceinigra]
MNASKLFTAVAALVLTGSAFAADAPAASTAVSAAAASSLSVPAVTINQSRSSSDVSAEAVQFVKNYKTAFAVQLEQYKN